MYLLMVVILKHLASMARNKAQLSTTQQRDSGHLFMNNVRVRSNLSEAPSTFPAIFSQTGATSTDLLPTYYQERIFGHAGLVIPRLIPA